MMRKNGEKIFVTFDGRIGQNADGSFKQTHCILKDETARKLAENEIFKQLTDKETLLKEVNHLVKNNIASIESLLSLQLNSISSPEAVSALNDALTRVKGMRILYDKLLLSKDYKDVSIKEYAESLIDAIYNVFSYDESVIVKKDIEDFELSIKLVLPIGIILNELLTNVFKYAFNGRDGGQVSIILDKSVNRISLKISDNGNGLDDDFELDKSTGFGLTIVKMLAEQLNGTFSIENDNGTKSVLNIDISNSE